MGWDEKAGEEWKSPHKLVWDILRLRSFWYSSGDVRWAVGYAGVEFRGKDGNLKIISLWILFKAMRSPGMAVNMEEKRSKDWDLRCSNTLRNQKTRQRRPHQRSRGESQMKMLYPVKPRQEIFPGAEKAS